MLFLCSGPIEVLLINVNEDHRNGVLDVLNLIFLYGYYLYYIKNDWIVYVCLTVVSNKITWHKFSLPSFDTVRQLLEAFIMCVCVENIKIIGMQKECWRKEEMR